MENLDYIKAYENKDYAKLIELIKQNKLDNCLDAILDLIEKDVKQLKDDFQG